MDLRTETALCLRELLFLPRCTRLPHPVLPPRCEIVLLSSERTYLWRHPSKSGCDASGTLEARGSMSNFYTRASYTRLMEELNRLRSEDLPAISRAKLTAAAEGDLSENAEYHASRERLEMLQRRIYELEDQL